MKQSAQSSVFASIMELSNREKPSLLIDYIQTILINLSEDLYLKHSLQEKWTQIAAEWEMLALNHSLFHFPSLAFFEAYKSAHMP